MTMLAITPLLAEASGNSWETISYIAAAMLACYTIIMGLRQWNRDLEWKKQDRENELKARQEERLQRDQELLWKQAELARKLLDDIFDYRPSDDAWKMVDEETTFVVGGKSSFSPDLKKRKIEIKKEHIKQALELNKGKTDLMVVLKDPDDEEYQIRIKYVRWCFDALFYYLERLEQSIEVNVVRFGDLKSPASYYIAKMSGEKEIYQNYAEFISFHGAVKFMERFSEWRVKTV
jgi:hypothetical protein